MLPKSRITIAMSNFAENLKTLPSVAGLERIELATASGDLVALIENKPGQAGSLALYNHLLHQYGCIDGAAASAGLSLYAEHAEDATRHPGKHPNIDRLFAIAAGDAALVGTIVAKA